MIGKEISIDKPYWLILEKKGNRGKERTPNCRCFSPHLVFVPNTTQTAVLQLRHRRDPLPVSGVPTVHL